MDFSHPMLYQPAIRHILKKVHNYWEMSTFPPTNMVTLVTEESILLLAIFYSWSQGMLIMC